MENQLTYPKLVALRLIVVALAVVLILFALILGFYVNRVSDPYVKEVLALKGDKIRGHAIFQINCVGCHEIYGDSNVGPNLHDVPRRKSKVGLIYQVISGKTPPMPKFQPKPQEMADLLSYLQNI